MSLQSNVDTVLKKAVDEKNVPFAGAIVINKDGKVWVSRTFIFYLKFFIFYFKIGKYKTFSD